MSWSLRGEALYPGALLTTGCAGRGGWSHNAGSTFQDVFGKDSLRIGPSGQIKLSCWGQLEERASSQPARESLQVAGGSPAQECGIKTWETQAFCKIISSLPLKATKQRALSLLPI